MSFRATFLTLVAIIAAVLTVLFIIPELAKNQRRKEESVKQTAKNEHLANDLPMPDLKEVQPPIDTPTAKLNEAIANLALLEKENPERYHFVEQSKQKFEQTKRDSIGDLDRKIAALKLEMLTELSPLTETMLVDINNNYGRRIEKLLDDLASSQSKTSGDFMHTDKSAELVKYITKEQADTGEYDAAIRKAYPYPARQAYFINLDSAISRYHEMAKLNGILDEYLSAVQQLGITRKQKDSEMKVSLSFQMSDLETKKALLLARTYESPAELTEFVKRYNDLSTQVDEWRLRVEQLVAVKREAELQDKRRVDEKSNIGSDEPAQSQNGPMGKWTSYSTGYTWASATEEEKWALCRRLASASRKGNSANFFYDALNTFFSEDNTRSSRLGDIVDSIEGASGALPLGQRNY